MCKVASAWAIFSNTDQFGAVKSTQFPKIPAPHRRKVSPLWRILMIAFVPEILLLILLHDLVAYLAWMLSLRPKICRRSQRKVIRTPSGPITWNKHQFSVSCYQVRSWSLQAFGIFTDGWFVLLKDIYFQSHELANIAISLCTNDRISDMMLIWIKWIL
jgi:hypothetical protein